jgi:tetratricopeptide (TPR) repeat protein
MIGNRKQHKESRKQKAEGRRQTNTNIFFCFLLSAFCFLPSIDSHAAFTDQPGLRALSLGGAFSSLSDDGSAAMWNPAGLSQLKRPEITATGGRLYAGLDEDRLGYGFLNYTQPLETFGAFGFSASQSTSKIYKESVLALSYSQRLKRLYLGASLKGLVSRYVKNEYTDIDPLFQDGLTSRNLSLDAGLLLKITDRLSIGASGLNLNEPNLALDKKVDAPLPFSLRGGVSYRFKYFTPAFDISYRNRKIGDETEKKDDINFHAGVEVRLAGDKIAIRGGGNKDEIAAGGSYISDGQAATFQLDYAIRYPTPKSESFEDTFGSHLFSLSVRFGSVKAKPKEAKVLENAKAKAMAMISKGDYEGAIHEYETLKQAYPKDTDLRRELAEVYLKLKDFEASISEYEAAIEIAPNAASLHYDLGQVCDKYYDITKESKWLDKAADAYENSYRLDPDYEDVSLRLTLIYMKKGEPEKARMHMQK